MKRKLLATFPVIGLISMSLLGWTAPDLGTAVPAAAEAGTLNFTPVLYDYETQTVQNIPVSGTLRIYDKENDAVSITVTTPPEIGEVVFDGLSFTYTPFLDQAGKDSFTCIATDSANNQSRACTVSLKVEKNESAFSYLDMKQNPSHYSAIKLYETGLISGEKTGGQFLFHPSQQLSRADFLLWILSVLEIDQKTQPCVNTGLQNDSQIPLWLKPYVKLALSQDILLEDRFVPNEIITRAEAVLLIDRAARIKDVRGYDLSVTDLGEIPDWAAQSYLNLGAYRMLDCYDGAAHPNDPLTRETAADLVWQLYKYNQKFHITE